ncbi:hypothetical protein CesoFtcFv8_026893 [Champsocephalus esox]|uniref:Uncharacterized protein n=1 Tax=Champsocephalus esox TaxID=159716 RepID=A0AAN8B001_9TELE|nr:hypothetical protein CesoFtcFv8_026893 [Champsocephalus esox]
MMGLNLRARQPNKSGPQSYWQMENQDYCHLSCPPLIPLKKRISPIMSTNLNINWPTFPQPSVTKIVDGQLGGNKPDRPGSSNPPRISNEVDQCDEGTDGREPAGRDIPIQLQPLELWTLEKIEQSEEVPLITQKMMDLQRQPYHPDLDPRLFSIRSTHWLNPQARHQLMEEKGAEVGKPVLNIRQNKQRNTRGRSKALTKVSHPVNKSKLMALEPRPQYPRQCKTPQPNN